MQSNIAQFYRKRPELFHEKQIENEGQNYFVPSVDGTEEITKQRKKTKDVKSKGTTGKSQQTDDELTIYFKKKIGFIGISDSSFQTQYKFIPSCSFPLPNASKTDENASASDSAQKINYVYKLHEKIIELKFPPGSNDHTPYIKAFMQNVDQQMIYMPPYFTLCLTWFSKTKDSDKLTLSKLSLNYELGSLAANYKLMLDNDGKLTKDGKQTIYNVVKGIYILHNNKTLHTNLKPTNILFGKLSDNITNWPLIDGVGEIYPYNSEDSYNSFYSPELIKQLAEGKLKEDVCTYASDIYALGKILKSIFNGGVEPEQEKTPSNAPDFIAKMINLMLSDDPLQRPTINYVFSQIVKFIKESNQSTEQIIMEIEESSDFTSLNIEQIKVFVKNTMLFGNKNDIEKFSHILFNRISKTLKRIRSHSLLNINIKSNDKDKFSKIIEEQFSKIAYYSNPNHMTARHKHGLPAFNPDYDQTSKQNDKQQSPPKSPQTNYNLLGSIGLLFEQPGHFHCTTFSLICYIHASHAGIIAASTSINKYIQKYYGKFYTRDHNGFVLIQFPNISDLNDNDFKEYREALEIYWCIQNPIPELFFKIIEKVQKQITKLRNGDQTSNKISDRIFEFMQKCRENNKEELEKLLGECGFLQNTIQFLIQPTPIFYPKVLDYSEVIHDP